MGKNSAIEWTDDTVNFWWGCVKVSPGCEHCYAETMSKRTGRNIWGPSKTTDRWRTKGPWKEILKWDREAKAEGRRRKVLCQSMSDFFEDHPQLGPWREEAIKILEGLEWLDIQLLTKRIENVRRMVPASWLESWPEHIWIGTSVENQKYAVLRIPELIRIPARIRFLSCEPLIDWVDLWPWLSNPSFAAIYGEIPPMIQWVITGGESGPKARPMHPDWVRSIRDQCQSAGTPFFMKQWGAFYPGEVIENGKTRIQYQRIGKKAAGAVLDGLEWREFPE